MANLIKVTDPQTVWKFAREIRKKFLKQNSNYGCIITTHYTKILVSDYNIKSNILSLEEKLKLAKNEIPSRRVSKQNLETAGNIFTYMNFCPTFQLHSFYKDLFKTASTKDIILALISLLKSSHNADKETTIKVFEKVMQRISSISKDFDYKGFVTHILLVKSSVDFVFRNVTTSKVC